MAIITDALVRVDNPDKQISQTLQADCFGNNAAVECPRCLSYPVLLIARPNQRGSSRANPATCHHCGARVYIAKILTGNPLVLNLAICEED
jgi:hypothetical protein